MPSNMEELLKVLSIQEASENDVVFFHTADATTYRDVLSIFCNAIMIKDWNRLPKFHLCTPYDEEVMPHNKQGRKAKDCVRFMKMIGLIDEHIFLYAENELLANHLTNKWGVAVKTLSIPPNIAIAHNTKKLNNEKIHVVYLGAARAEKGFNLLPELIKKVYESHLYQKIRFTLQLSPQIIGYMPDIKKTISKLKRLKSNSLTLIKKAMSDEKYNEVLNSADVILLCYDKDRYRVRGSGIAVEAVTNGVIIISTPGTYPSYIAGEAGLTASNIDEIFEALVKVSMNKRHYNKLAKARRDWYLEKYSGKNYYDILINGNTENTYNINSEKIESKNASKVKLDKKIIIERPDLVYYS